MYDFEEGSLDFTSEFRIRWDVLNQNIREDASVKALCDAAFGLWQGLVDRVQEEVAKPSMVVRQYPELVDLTRKSLYHGARIDQLPDWLKPFASIVKPYDYAPEIALATYLRDYQIFPASYLMANEAILKCRGVRWLLSPEVFADAYFMASTSPGVPAAPAYDLLEGPRRFGVIRLSADGEKALELVQYPTDQDVFV